jgi:aspartyl-tRNA(Asn)/glutamyl-tRNA(Gln) amidotransferase subunit A
MKTLTVSLEECILQKGTPASAGSKILENFTAPFSASVADRLVEGGAVIAKKSAMDEFGVFKLSEDFFGGVSGAVQDVTEGAVRFALCNDVFGGQRRQAALSGACYIRPTYGTVSRRGLIPLASSMDQIGIVCRHPSEGFELLSMIAGNDPGDGAMFPDPRYVYSADPDRKLRVGFPRRVWDMAGPEARGSALEFTDMFETADIELKHFNLYKQVLYILSCAEISNNINRYDGVKFGYRASVYKNLNDLYLNTRTEGFGLDTKLAAVMGCMVLSKDNYAPYYEKAMKLRREIKESANFGEYDLIALPTEIGGGAYENLSLFALSPLAGLPSLSFGFKGAGIQLIAAARDENALLTAGQKSSNN